MPSSVVRARNGRVGAPCRATRLAHEARHAAATRALGAAVLIATIVAAAVPSRLAAQAGGTRPDTGRAATVAGDSTRRADSTRAHELGRVIISAVRAAPTAPISRGTINREEVEQRYFGQDVPLLLQGATPSLTAHSETGTYWGYSYIRLRGVDQSRINLTLDGIPLNDPEDQVLYFADFPDLANSIQSVQVQRGVGTSSNGTAAYAGSINMETISPADGPARGGVTLEAGSFGSRRIAADYTTGLLPGRLAFHGRISALETDGYRHHSGVRGRSAFVSGGYFGDRDILKLTATAGYMRDTMAYLGVSEAELAVDRRSNPLSPRERDGFGEQLAALSYTRLLGPSTSLATTVYRISASGDYDVVVDSLWNFNLDFTWYGVTSAWSYDQGNARVDLGVNANIYSRDHYAYEHPELATPLYFNTGHKRDQSGFAKVSYTLGRATLFGDVQARHANFSYTPDPDAGLARMSTSWAFLNPKAGITYELSEPLSVYASYGRNSREPARGDMFAGEDDLDAAMAASLGGLDRVRPETVHDLELGARYEGRTLRVQGNLYSMDFRNEIAPIGALTINGSPLRQNVGRSFRRGVEMDALYRGLPRLVLGGNVAISHNRIREFTDMSGDSPVTYHDVAPLLTPSFQGAARARLTVTPSLELGVEGRYQGESYLQNTGDRRFMLPASGNLDASISWQLPHAARSSLVVRGSNLTDSRSYGSGYASDGVAYYFVNPPRNVFVTLRVGM